MYADQKPTRIKSDSDSFLQNVLNQISNCCTEEKNLMISVFDVINNKFLFCNDSFNKVLGFSNKEMMDGGWEYWYKKMNPEEVPDIKSKLELLNKKALLGKRFNMISLSYHIKDVFNKWRFVNHDFSIHQFIEDLIVISYIHDISQKERIEYFFETKKQFSFYDNDPIVISKREKEVLQLIAEGFSSKQIAKELYISDHTAISHRKNLIEKFKVKNTAQLIKEASKSILL